MIRRSLILAGMCLFVLTPWMTACPFCNSSGATLAQDASSAALIVFGSPKNAKFDPREFATGSTEIAIESIIKSHTILGDRKSITVAKYLPSDPKQPLKYLVFCDVYRGEIDAYRGTPFKPESKIAEYLKGALDRKERPVGERLRYFFDFLEDADAEIAQDAYTEFGNVEYKDFRPVAEKLPAEKVAGWINDAGSASSRLGLYGSMLGHCGKAEHFETLKAVIGDPKRMYLGGVDGVFAGLALLKPKEGWAEIETALHDKSRDYLLRYAALRSARFLWEFRPDVVERDVIAKSVTRMLDQPDLADLAIEDLRKWGYWAAIDRVVGLTSVKEFDTVLIRRSVLRYALQCPNNPAALKYVASRRAQDPKTVDDIEALLQAESIPPAPTKPGK